MREALQKKATGSPKRSAAVIDSNRMRRPNPVAVLQGSIGNRAVKSLFRSGVIQAKLGIGRPNDIYEREADRVADQVMRMPDTAISNRHSAIGGGNGQIQMKPG